MKNSITNKQNIVIPKFSKDITLALEYIADNDVHVYNMFNDMNTDCIWIKFETFEVADKVLRYVKSN